MSDGVDSNIIIGTETLKLRVCSCVKRDSKKILSKSGKVSKPTAKTGKVKSKLPVHSLYSPLMEEPHPSLDFTPTVKKDVDGCYNFTVREK